MVEGGSAFEREKQGSNESEWWYLLTSMWMWWAMFVEVLAIAFLPLLAVQVMRAAIIGDAPGSPMAALFATNGLVSLASAHAFRFAPP